MSRKFFRRWFLLWPFSVFAQDGNEPELRGRTRKICWEPSTGTLTWETKFFKKPEDEEEAPFITYTIRPKNRSMTLGKETRYFTSNEGESLAEILRIITDYAGKSAWWWESGQGSKTPLGPETPVVPSNDSKKIERFKA